MQTNAKISVFLLCALVALSSAQYSSYNNSGSDWTGLCQTGKQQSPINVPNTDNMTLSNDVSLDFNYVQTVSNVGVLHNEGLLLVASSNMGTISVRMPGHNQPLTYQASDIQFHAPSEHTIQGKHFDLEAQITHTLTSGSQANDTTAPITVIVSILFSAQTNDPSVFLDDLGFGKNSTTNNFNVGLASFASKLHTFAYYQGSQTEAPCVEGESWYVFTDIQEMSAVQKQSINQFWSGNSTFAGGKGNNRITQNLNGRQVYKGVESSVFSGSSLVYALSGGFAMTAGLLALLL